MIRYKQSVLQATNTDSHMQSFPTAFTQWIADNVDHNVLTLGGLGTFQGMGVIAVSTRLEQSPEFIREEAIVKIKKGTSEGSYTRLRDSYKIVLSTRETCTVHNHFENQKTTRISLNIASISESRSVVGEWLAHT